jgi:hypothetical protein
MRHASRHATGLRHHQTVYTLCDARLDNPHLPAAELARLVAAARSSESCPHLRRSYMLAYGCEPPLRTRVATRV